MTDEINNPPIANAVIYIRVSTDRQVGNASLETQERDCRTMCKVSGWEVVRVFREEGASAKTVARPQLQELLNFCRTSKPRPDYVVVYHVDRWARSGQDHDMMRAFLAKFGVKLRSCLQQLGEDPLAQFFERIMSGQAELDNRLRGMRSVAGMKTRIQGGRWPFKAPLGYFNAPDAKGAKTLIPDEARAGYVSLAFELYATGLYSKEQVRLRVNAEGLRTQNGKTLSTESFSRMLQNPRYAGILCVEKWEMSATGDYEPLISVETFKRVQDLLLGRRVTITPKQRNNPDFPLRNFVHCGLCRRPLTASWSKGKMGVKYAYHRCQNRKCPSPENIRRDDLEGRFLSFLRQHQPNPGYVRLFHKVVLDAWKSKQADSDLLVEKLQKQVDEIKERKKKLQSAFLFQESINQHDYAEWREALSEELTVAELNLSQARVDQMGVEDLLDFAESVLLDSASIWKQCSLEQKQRLQQVLFPQGVEYENGVYRTQETAFLFKGFEALMGAEEVVGSANGNRTRV